MKRGIRALSLLETLIYFSVLITLMALGYRMITYCREDFAALYRNTHDIQRAVEAGEIWREDIRRATAPPQTMKGILRIPQTAGAVHYRFEQATVWRKAPPQKDWQPLLPKIAASTMTRRERQKMAYWSWELELQGAQRPRLKPLFSFQAVPRATQE